MNVKWIYGMVLSFIMMLCSIFLTYTHDNFLTPSSNQKQPLRSVASR